MATYHMKINLKYLSTIKKIAADYPADPFSTSLVLKMVIDSDADQPGKTNDSDSVAWHDEASDNGSSHV